MLIEAEFTCAYCGAFVVTTVDPSAGRQQSYTEDCQVCCRPNLLEIEIDPDGESATIEAQPETDIL
jgi:hypothetical protein